MIPIGRTHECCASVAISRQASPYFHMNFLVLPAHRVHASHRRYEEAFNHVLHIGDVDLVDWLCAQVDPGELCAKDPVPLSQGVLLSLLSQLSTSLSKVDDPILAVISSFAGVLGI